MSDQADLQARETRVVVAEHLQAQAQRLGIHPSALNDVVERALRAGIQKTSTGELAVTGGRSLESFVEFLRTVEAPHLFQSPEPRKVKTKTPPKLWKRMTPAEKLAHANGEPLPFKLQKETQQ